VLDLHNELETMIANPIGPAVVSVDDAEFENELADLLNEEEDAGPPGGGTPAFDIHSNFILFGYSRSNEFFFFQNFQMCLPLLWGPNP